LFFTVQSNNEFSMIRRISTKLSWACAKESFILFRGEIF